MAHIRTPKYKYGLLESPMSSYFSSSGNELSTTVLTDETARVGSAKNGPSVHSTEKGIVANKADVTDSSPEVTNISYLSSIPGDLRGRSTEKTYTDTLLASSEESNNEGSRGTNTGTPNHAVSSARGSSSSHVFQLPTGPAPRKTPRFTPSARVQSTPRSRGHNISSSGGSRSDRYGTPRHPKKTPRSSRSDVTETPRLIDSANIVSIVEGRGQARGEIGMASIDLKHPVVEISQFADSQTYVKTISRLQILAPVEVIFPNTMYDSGNMVKLFRVVSDNFQNSNITTVQRHYFNETKGMECIKNLGVKEHSSVEMDVQRKYYCLAATAALIKYVEFIENTMFANHSLKIAFKGSDQTTLIDSSTAAILELVINGQDPKSADSLYGLLNHTQTSGGARWLRSNIMQPPNGVETITLRQDSVHELTTNKELFFALKECLSRFEVDVDSLLTSIVTIPKQDTERIVENKITACIMLKHILQLMPVLENILSDGKSQLLRAYNSALKDPRFNDLLDKILHTIHDGAQYQKGHLNMRNQKCFAVRSGINGILDASRRTYSELIEDTNEIIGQLAEMHNLPIKCAFNASRGFFIQMPMTDKSRKPPKLPPIFLKVTKNRSTISCTTDDLICMNGKINQAVKSIYGMANEVVSDLLAEVRGLVGCLYKLSEIISMLDVLVSLAHVAMMSDYVRPEFTDTLAIKQGRHPILEKLKRQTNPVPNDVYVADEANFLIITGPNMSGKSTFLKQIALLQVMAQIGSFVPAEYASFRIADQIFSRVGSDDDMETNSSSFTLEMKEMNYIIQNVTDNSLVIIDELGRGTSSEEGVGLCWAIAEFLLSQKAFTFFATHFLEICRLESLYPNVENMHFKIDHVTTKTGNLYKILYTYVLSRGHCDEKHYGLQLAEYSNLPKSITDKAWEIARFLDQGKDQMDMAMAGRYRQEKATYRLAHRLLQISRSCVLEGEALKSLLQNCRDEYIADLLSCENECAENGQPQEMKNVQSNPTKLAKDSNSEKIQEKSFPREISNICESTMPKSRPTGSCSLEAMFTGRLLSESTEILPKPMPNKSNQVCDKPAISQTSNTVFARQLTPSRNTGTTSLHPIALEQVSDKLVAPQTPNTSESGYRIAFNSAKKTTAVPNTSEDTALDHPPKNYNFQNSEISLTSGSPTSHNSPICLHRSGQISSEDKLPKNSLSYWLQNKPNFPSPVSQNPNIITSGSHDITPLGTSTMTVHSPVLTDAMLSERVHQSPSDSSGGGTRGRKVPREAMASEKLPQSPAVSLSNSILDTATQRVFHTPYIGSGDLNHRTTPPTKTMNRMPYSMESEEYIKERDIENRMQDEENRMSIEISETRLHVSGSGYSAATSMKKMNSAVSVDMKGIISSNQGRLVSHSSHRPCGSSGSLNQPNRPGFMLADVSVHHCLADLDSSN